MDDYDCLEDWLDDYYCEYLGGYEGVPRDILKDSKGKNVYHIGELLGRGGFSRCYKLFDFKKNKDYAVKIIKKKFGEDEDQNCQVYEEVRILRRLDYPNIVKMHNCFSNDSFYYIVLELCDNNTLRTLLKEKKIIEINEAKYYLKEIAKGISYLHSLKIMHRDLKLSNVFITNKMDVKIGDFGLAIYHRDPEKKLTKSCGTRIYQAPEFFSKRGYSFEVDIFSLGCIFYTLIIGKHPFEQKNEELMRIIKIRNYYRLPEFLDCDSKNIISKLLARDPEDRPKIVDILNSKYLRDKSLLKRFLFPSLYESLNSTDNRNNNECDLQPLLRSKSISQKKTIFDSKECLRSIFNKIHNVFSSKKRQFVSSDKMKDALCSQSYPKYFVMKWSNLTCSYGFLYELSNSCVGIEFNDKTHIIGDSDVGKIQYTDENSNKDCFDIYDCPTNLSNKLRLLKYSKNYFNKLGFAEPTERLPNADNSSVDKSPIVIEWKKDETAIGLLLSNGTLQVNFLKDHIKIIISSPEFNISIIDKNKKLKTYNLAALKSNGWDEFMDKKICELGKFIREWITIKRKHEDDENVVPVKK